MSDILTNKMTFRSFDKNTFKERNAIAEYEVMMNPATISRTLASRDEKKNARGAVAFDGKWTGLESENFNFDLIFDGTGIVNPKKTDVEAEIEQFLKVVYIPDKKNITQAFVEISYGMTTINCKMSSITIDYQLFNRAGKPIRAKISCAFKTVRLPEDKKPKPDEKKPKVPDNKEPEPEDKTPAFDCCNPPPSCCKEVQQKAKKNDDDTLYSSISK